MRPKILLLLILTVFLLSACTSSISAQGISYQVDKEYCTLYVEKSGEVKLVYELKITVLQGEIKRFVRVGIPVPTFDVVYVKEKDTGKTPSYEKEVSSEGSYLIIHPTSPIGPGGSRTYEFEVVLHHFLYRDETNPGNVGLMFTPCWFDAVVKDLRVSVVLPEGVGKGEVKNTPDYDNLEYYNGRIVLYWERHDLSPNEKFSVGVSFPEKYVNVEEVSAQPSGQPSTIDVILSAIIPLIGIVIVAWVLISMFRGFISAARLIKAEFTAPKMFVESLGPRKDLHPAEVAYLEHLEGKKIGYPRILLLILLSLAKKKIVRIKSEKPLRVEVVEENRKGVILRAFEKVMLKCIDEDGKLEEDCLVKVIKVLHRSVERRLAAYSRGETLKYFRKRISDLWNKVEAAPQEEKVQVVMDNIEWLLVDPDFEKKVRHYLRGEATVRLPTSRGVLWYWWWYGPTYYPTYVPPPSAPPSPPPAAPPPQPPQMPVVTSLENFANQIATSIENAANGLVGNIENFANRVAEVIGPPTPAGSSRSPVISCACVSCACACACVSCACACAGGGVG